MEHHVKPPDKPKPYDPQIAYDEHPDDGLFVRPSPELQPKLDIARAHARKRLATFADELIPQAFMVRFFGKEQSMSTQLPEEEPGSIPWEGGAENKGDEPGETRDPHKQDPEGIDEDDE